MLASLISTERVRGFYTAARLRALTFLDLDYECITPKQRAKGLPALSAVERDFGDYDQVHVHCHQALSLVTMDDSRMKALVQQQLGEIEIDQGRYADANESFTEAASFGAVAVAAHPTDVWTIACKVCMNTKYWL